MWAQFLVYFAFSLVVVRRAGAVRHLGRQLLRDPLELRLCAGLVPRRRDLPDPHSLRSSSRVGRSPRAGADLESAARPEGVGRRRSWRIGLEPLRGSQVGPRPRARGGRGAGREGVEPAGPSRHPPTPSARGAARGEPRPRRSARTGPRSRAQAEQQSGEHARVGPPPPALVRAAGWRCPVQQGRPSALSSPEVERRTVMFFMGDLLGHTLLACNTYWC